MAAIIAKALEASSATLTKNLDQVIATTLKQFADAADQVAQERRPAHLRRRARTAIPGQNVRRFLPGRRPQRRQLSRKALRQHLQRLANQSGPGRRVRRNRRLHRAARFLRAAHQPSWKKTPSSANAPSCCRWPPRRCKFLIWMSRTVQSAGVSPFFGGVQMYWTAEAQTRTETEPAFKQLELKANELSGYSVSSNILLQDCGLRPGEVPVPALRPRHRLVRGIRLPPGQRRRQAAGRL